MKNINLSPPKPTVVVVPSILELLERPEMWEFLRENMLVLHGRNPKVEKLEIKIIQTP